MSAPDPRRFAGTAWCVIGTLVLMVPLAAHARSGWGSRYVGDDYCAAYVFQDHGLIGGQLWFYQNWGAVPTTLALMALTDPMGIAGAQATATIVLALWLVATFVAIQQLARMAPRRWHWSQSMLLASALVVAGVETAPHIVQSLYLRVPTLAYTVPLIAATLYVAFATRAINAARPARRTDALSFVFAFVAGSFGPVYAAGQTAALGIGWLLARFVFDSVVARRLCAAGAAGSVASLAFVALAPGNITRQQFFPAPPGWLTIAVWSVLYAIFLLSRPLLPVLEPLIVALAPVALGTTPRWLPTALEMSASPMLYFLVIGAAGLVAWSAFDDATPAAVRRARTLLWALPAIASVIVVACMSPGAYGTSAPPPPRALIIPQFVVLCLAAAWSAAAAVVARAKGSTLPLRPTLAVLGVLILLTSGRATMQAWRAGDEMHAWAARWDVTDRAVRSAAARGLAHAIVPAVGPIGGVGAITESPGDWVNACAAQYYGVETISGTSTR